MNKSKMIAIATTEAVEKRIKEMELVKVVSNQQLEIQRIYKDSEGKMWQYDSYADYLNSERWVSTLEKI